MIAISEFEIFWGWKKKHIYIANQKDRERKKEFHYATGFFFFRFRPVCMLNEMTIKKRISHRMRFFIWEQIETIVKVMTPVEFLCNTITVNYYSHVKMLSLFNFLLSTFYESFKIATKSFLRKIYEFLLNKIINFQNRRIRIKNGMFL